MVRNSPSKTEPCSRARSVLEVVGVVLATGILILAIMSTSGEKDRVSTDPMDMPVRVREPVRVDLTGYVGEQACAGCHPGEMAFHSGSGHHRTLWPAGKGSLARKLDGLHLADPELPGVEWTYHQSGKDFQVERREKGDVKRLVLEYGVGSGKHGVSFVTTVAGADPSVDRGGIEHRFSYFAPAQKLQVTMGQEQADASHLHLKLTAFGRELSPEKTLGCLNCHATVTSRDKANHLDPSTLIPNVSCERCHGPGRDHIEAVKAESEDLRMPMAMLTDPWSQVRQCGECHRLPSSVEESALNPDNPGIVRFQSVGLSLSPCFQNGLGTLKCTTCHDGHARTSRDRRAYEAVCLDCHHAGGKRQICPVAPRGECVGCHMPRRDVPGGFVFTDHWIRKPSPPSQRQGGHPDFRFPPDAMQ
jgi:hypothetical protein